MRSLSIALLGSTMLYSGFAGPVAAKPDAAGSGSPTPVPVAAAAPTPVPVPPASPAPIDATVIPVPPAATPTVVAGKEPKRKPPVVTEIRTDIPIPTATKRKVGNQGGQSYYDFDKLTVVGASFGVKDRTAKSMASTVSSANKRALKPAKDAAGNDVMVDEAVLGADGKPLIDGNNIAVTKKVPKMEQTAKYEYFEVDPSTDKDGASVRIFRVA